MVMRNRNNGGSAPHWWDDLPPKVRDRFTRPLATPEPSGAEPEADEPPRPLGRHELVTGLSALAALFTIFTFGIMLYLLVAVRFVTG